MWADAKTPSAPATRVATAADAKKLIDEIRATMAQLEKLLSVETEHVRVGRINEGLAQEERKTELTTLYLQGLETLKANAVALARFAPQHLEILKKDHAAFSQVIATNQLVLATARAVSESLVKGIAEELGRAGQASGYRPAGPVAPRQQSATPLLVSKTL
jgi:hypothetical protein